MGNCHEFINFKNTIINNLKTNNMKQLLILALCFIAFTSVIKATTSHSYVINKVDTGGSFIDTVKGAIQVEPIVVNAMSKDTVYQLGWTAFGLSSDTTVGCNTYVQLYTRKGTSVMAFNCPIPASVTNRWGSDNTIIDDYILSQYPLLKRK